MIRYKYSHPESKKQSCNPIERTNSNFNQTTCLAYKFSTLKLEWHHVEYTVHGLGVRAFRIWGKCGRIVGSGRLVGSLRATSTD